MKVTKRLSRRDAKNAKKVFIRCDLCGLARKKKTVSQGRQERKDDFKRCDLCGLARKKSSRRDAKNAKKVFKRCDLCSLARNKRIFCKFIR